MYAELPREALHYRTPLAHIGLTAQFMASLVAMKGHELLQDVAKELGALLAVLFIHESRVLHSCEMLESSEHHLVWERR